MEVSQAQTHSSLEEKLNKYTWKKRVLLVIAPTEKEEQLQRQQALLNRQKPGLQDRDMEIIYLPLSKLTQIDKAYLIQTFTISPNEFYVILIGKDGTEKRRSNTALDPENLFDTIDAMPMRRQEMKDQ